MMSRRLWPPALFLTGFVAVIEACGHGDTPLIAQVVEGRQFAHDIQLPSRFNRSSEDRGMRRFDRYAFRVAESSPNVLLIKACRYELVAEHSSEVLICSGNTFSIDAESLYSVREVTQSHWDQARPIDGCQEMDGRSQDVKRELAKPANMRPLPIGPEVEKEGYKYRGKEYVRRAKWISALNFVASGDGRLIVLAGYDRHHLFSSGTFTIDIFDADPTRRVAALDLDYRTAVEGHLGRVSVVSSRWVAIGLDFPKLQHILLLDVNEVAAK
jgi:hypothetical protein